MRRADRQVGLRQDCSVAVFAGRTGERLQSDRHWFEDAIKAAEIDNFRWHDLRHTFESRLAMKGVGIRAIQAALGHKSLAMTVRYSHLSPDFQQEAVDKLVRRRRLTLKTELRGDRLLGVTNQKRAPSACPSVG